MSNLREKHAKKLSTHVKIVDIKHWLGTLENLANAWQ